MSLLVATKSFIAMHEGRRFVVKAGKTRVDSEHAIVKGRENHFTEVDRDALIEDTTARPGRKRGRRPAEPKDGPQTSPADGDGQSGD